MITIYRAHGMRFVIFSNDHEPAHVHAIVGSGEAKINLIGSGQTGFSFSPNGGASMADISEIEIDAALARGAAARKSEPRASAVRYDAAARRIVISFATGTEMIVPIHLLEGLAGATDAEIAEVELLGAGYGLHWETLDVDLTVPGLVMGIFGTAKWMAKIAGQTKSEKKAAAARANGALGGRPRKTVAKT